MRDEEPTATARNTGGRLVGEVVPGASDRDRLSKLCRASRCREVKRGRRNVQQRLRADDHSYGDDDRHRIQLSRLQRDLSGIHARRQAARRDSDGQRIRSRLRGGRSDRQPAGAVGGGGRILESCAGAGHFDRLIERRGGTTRLESEVQLILPDPQERLIVGPDHKPDRDEQRAVAEVTTHFHLAVEGSR